MLFRCELFLEMKQFVGQAYDLCTSVLNLICFVPGRHVRCPCQTCIAWLLVNGQVQLLSADLLNEI